VLFISDFLSLKNRKIKILVCLVGAIFIILDLFTNLIIQGVVNTPEYSFPEPGPIYLYFFIFFVSCTIYGIYELAKAYSKSSSIQKNKVRYLLFSSIFGYVGGLKNFLIVAGIKPFLIYPLGTYAIPIYTLVVAYAIVKHQLMDIKVIIKRTLVFAGLFAASYAIFAFFIFLGQDLLGNITGGNKWLSIIPSIFVIVLMLRPLEEFLRNLTDKYLFQKKYDYKALLKTFTDEVLTVLNLNELVDITVDRLADVMKLENATIFLYDEGNGEFRMASSAGSVIHGYALSDKDRLIEHMRKNGKYIIAESKEQKKSISKGVRERMHEVHAELAIPLMHYKNMIGVLSLGKKKSDEEFTQDDMDILLPLTRALSIAITNAQLFEKLSMAQAQAAQREKMAVIGTLSAGINHEICNPLSIIRGQCEMFLLNLREGLYKNKSMKELLEKAKVIMEKVITETDRATIITRKLSSFAKPAKRKSENNVIVEREIEEVSSLIQHELKLSNIEVVKEIEKGLPSISADPKQMQEIFFNIIRNAAQSIEGSGKITIRAASEDAKVYINIKDTGKGMTKEHLRQIFNPFFTTKAPGEGTGLGLFIVKQIVEKNGGEITVQSKSGEGTNVCLVFNAAPSNEKVTS
jgi:signal transduction histidine kinase